jgi:hypothetical protein
MSPERGCTESVEGHTGLVAKHMTKRCNIDWGFLCKDSDGFANTMESKHTRLHEFCFTWLELSPFDGVEDWSSTFDRGRSAVYAYLTRDNGDVLVLEEVLWRLSGRVTVGAAQGQYPRLRAIFGDACMEYFGRIIGTRSGVVTGAGRDGDLSACDHANCCPKARRGRPPWRIVSVCRDSGNR